jgi:multidrug efflux pump subunit AcrA (membrane-fusion protein)
MLSALTVPGEAIVPDGDGVPVIFVYEPDSRRVYSRRVRVGTVYGEEVEVLSGLEGTEMIVVGGQHRVRDGSLVDATTAEVAAPAGVDGR